MKKIVSILLVLALVILWSSSAVIAQEPAGEGAVSPPEVGEFEEVTLEPTPTETATPEPMPTEAATEQPTEAATEQPTEAATEQPTEAATEQPTEAATEQPTEAAVPDEEIEEIIENPEEEIVEPGETSIIEEADAALEASNADISSAAATSKALSTNFTMVNLGTAPATVSLEYRKNTGALWPVGAAYQGPFTLAANGGSVQLRQYFDTAMSSGKGSVVLSSDQPLGAISQILARGQVPSSGAYSGANAGSSQVYAPLVAKQGSSASGIVNAEIVIQNTGTSNVSVAVDFYNNSNGALAFTKTGISIPGNTSYYYDLSTEAGLPNNWFGSAVVRATSSGGNVAVVVNLFLGPHALQTYNGFPASQAATKWMNPSFFSRLTNGLSTVMTVQNLSASDWPVNSVVASCVRTQGSGPANFTLRNTTTIVKRNAPYNFNPVTDMSIPSNWVGACTVTTPGAAVMIVQMRFVGAPYPEAAAFNALNANGTSRKCSVPLIAKRLPNGFATVFTVQNLSTTNAAHVTFQYRVNAAESAPGTRDVTVGPYTIPAGASLQHNHRLPGNGGSGSLVHNLPDGWVGSVVVTSSDQPIDCYAQLTYYTNKSGDTFMAHNGFTY